MGLCGSKGAAAPPSSSRPPPSQGQAQGQKQGSQRQQGPGQGQQGSNSPPQAAQSHAEGGGHQSQQQQQRGGGGSGGNVRGSGSGENRGTSGVSGRSLSGGGSGRQKSQRQRPNRPETSKSGKSFNELYKLGKNLGEGAFSVVKEGSHKQSNVSYAIKIVTKSKLTQEDEVALKDEINVLKELRHEHIIRLYDVFDESQYYYLVTERMAGGELFDRVVSKSYYNEKEARDVCRILFESIGYCHSHHVAHRDLKPENLLLLSAENDSAIKIADFGFAKKCPPGDGKDGSSKCLTTQCGTPGYVAPEILEGIPYDTKADMWSLGVIAYILLGGYPPFIEQNQRDLFRKIRKGQYEFHEEYWGRVSTGAKALIASLLTVNPDERIGAEEALKNEWILMEDEALAGKDLGANLVEFKKFNAKRKFKAAVKVVIASNKISSLGENFKQNISASNAHR